jgi:hypothetical protein
VLARHVFADIGDARTRHAAPQVVLAWRDRRSQV